MRLAILTLDFPPDTGGVQTYLGEISPRLSRRGEVCVITPVATSSAEPFHREVVPPTIPAFIRALRQFAPDRVLVGHAHPRLLIPAALVAWRRYAVCAYGNDYLAAQRRWHRPIFNALLHRANPLITISRANALRLRQLGVPHPVVIYPGTDPLRFYPPPVPPPPPWTLLTVGRLVPRKGIDLVIQTLPSLLDDFPALRYRIVGDGPDRARLEALADRLGVSEVLEFSGRVPDAQLPEVYCGAHIFVMPVREERASVEGFGIVYLEASASGLPVVAGRSGGAVEAVRDGETGFLVPPGDRVALLRVLRRLLLDPNLRHCMGTAGRRWVEEKMNWDRAAQEVLDVLKGN